MFYRWLHKTWKYFWRIVFGLLLIITLISGIIMGLLQLDVIQNYLSNRIETQLEQTYKADLSIGDIDGFLPFRLRLHDVVLDQLKEDTSKTIVTVDQIETEIDVWALLQNRLTIVGFSVVEPVAKLQSNREGKLMLLERRPDAEARDKKDNELWLSKIEIIAPSVNITDGVLNLTAENREHQIGNLSPDISLKNIDATLFVDWSRTQRYLDIESLTAESENLHVTNLAAAGQLYNDERFLEFNSFYLTLGNSKFILNGDIEGVNMLEPDVTAQLAEAQYDLNISSEEIYMEDIQDLLPNRPNLEQPFYLDFRAEGTADSLWVDRAELGMGESFINLNGLFNNIFDRQNLAYRFRFNGVNLQHQNLSDLFEAADIPTTAALQSITITGKAEGMLDYINADFSLKSSLGSIALEGKTQLRNPYQYYGTIKGTDVDISPFFEGRMDTTSLNFESQFDGEGLTLKQAISNIDVQFSKSRVGKHEFESLNINSSLADGIWNTNYEYENNEEFLEGSSKVEFTAEEKNLAIEGNAQNINMTHFFGDKRVAQTALNFDYNIALQGFNLERIHGRASLDIHPSRVGGDTVGAHQFYVDLNNPDEATRELRLTSSLFDMNISGQITPADIVSQTTFWRDYLTNRFKSDILLTQPVDSTTVNRAPPAHNMVAVGSIRAKNLSLIQKYLPDFPAFYTDSEIEFNVNTDGTHLLLSAEIDADTLRYNHTYISKGRTQFTASFRSDRTFREFSSVDLEADIRRLETEFVDFDSLGIDLAVKQDSVFFTQQAETISDNAKFRMALESSISDSAVNIAVRDFFVGNNLYAWVNENVPRVTYNRNGVVGFNNFIFKNENEYFQLQGKLSNHRDDSMRYVLRNINLSRVSDLIKGKIDFSGIMNGTFVTKSLTNQPIIQGDLSVNRFQLNNRMVGDVRFNSDYNPGKDRFDTQIDIITDSTKYQNYLASNDNIGQDIRLNGYFLTPEPSVRQDSLYYFDADFKQVDLWFLALIADNVFTEVEGQASGTGYITGNLGEFDFGSQFETQNVFVRPKFINTNYFLNGPVQFNKSEGVILDSLSVMDTKGGKGTVWGTVDLNDFDPITYLDLTMDMNRLQFLNNKMDPDVPFYGSVSGTGRVRLSGSNTDMYLRTQEPVQITSDSEISIPLLKETELQETGKFIRFVDSFDQTRPQTQSVVEQKPQETDRGEEAAIKQALANMTFSERFDLDLNFNAPNNVTVHLIFDSVTGEILTAQGTGQMRITMQDQNVQMFGQYNISNGNYKFVTGEIISRRLQLESGGTIIWEGSPDNARLDISAVYNARPNVSTLLNSDDSNDQSGSQQVPVELIIEINGTLNSVENNYYFRFPSSLDLSSNPTLQYTLNQINRDEQQKLLQATSILFTGQFIPTQDVGSGTATLSQNLTRGSTYVNPFLSNQVSSLLSNQINTLLNSDVSQLDIDFNLNAYNQVNLGIALRLYNDRLILRREGQIAGGGQQNTPVETIGDLNAIYRIRKGLSLTAFHRQDQTLNSVQYSGSQVGDVVPYVDGIGLEARVQFNTWEEMMDRIRRIFGIGKDSGNNDQKN